MELLVINEDDVGSSTGILEEKRDEVLDQSF